VKIDGPTDSLHFDLSWEGKKPEDFAVSLQGDADPTKL
jgi:hypothetical protein